MHRLGVSQRAGVRWCQVPLSSAMRLSLQAISLNAQILKTRRRQANSFTSQRSWTIGSPSGESAPGDAEPAADFGPGLASLFKTLRSSNGGNH